MLDIFPSKNSWISLFFFVCCPTGTHLCHPLGNKSPVRFRIQDDEIYHLKAPEGLKAGCDFLWVGLTITTQRVGRWVYKEGSRCSSNLGWWLMVSNLFLFSSRKLGKIPILTSNIFQSWNHQLVITRVVGCCGSWSSWLWSPLVIVKNTSIINTESHFVKFEIGQLWDVCFEWLCQSFVRFSNSLDNGYGHRSGFVKDLSGLRKINIPMLASQNRCFVNQARLRLSQAEGGATQNSATKKTRLQFTPLFVLRFPRFFCPSIRRLYSWNGGGRPGVCGEGSFTSPPPRWEGGGVRWVNAG